MTPESPGSKSVTETEEHKRIRLVEEYIIMTAHKDKKLKAPTSIFGHCK